MALILGLAQHIQWAREIRHKLGVNLQVFMLPFLIYPTACLYKTGKNIIATETSVKSVWKQPLNSGVIKSEERDL